MDLFLLFSLTHKNNEIKSPTKIYDFTVFLKNFNIANNFLTVSDRVSIFRTCVPNMSYVQTFVIVP